MTSMVQTDFGPAVSSSASSSSSATTTAIDTAAASATNITAPKYKESPIDDSVCACFSYIFLVFLFLNSIPGFPRRRGYGQGVFQITMLP